MYFFIYKTDIHLVESQNCNSETFHILYLKYYVVNRFEAKSKCKSLTLRKTYRLLFKRET